MGRINKNISGVFTDIVGDTNKYPLYDTFIKTQDYLKKPSKDLKKYLSEYESLVTKNKHIFEKMANLENVIMQIRAIENFRPYEIKFNIVRQYINARIPFYRRDKKAKDIRVIAGLVDVYGTNIDEYYKNPEFMEITRNKLMDSMFSIITENMNNLIKTK